MKKRLLSLFSGAGGMDIGFEGNFSILKGLINANLNKSWVEKQDEKYYYLKDTIFETVFANDINPYAKLAWNTYFSSKKENIFRLASIIDLVNAYDNDSADIFPENVDIVTGGFPCQDFSVAGKRMGFDSEKDHFGQRNPNENTSGYNRGNLYLWMKKVIEITKPKIFIAENVKGLTNMAKAKQIIQADFASIDFDGYLVVEPKVLKMADYGIPQSRERVFFMGFRKSALKLEAILQLSKQNILPDWNPYPSPTHLWPNFAKSKFVLDDLPEPEFSNDFSQKYYSKAKFMGKHCQGQNEVNLEGLAPTIRSEHHGNIEFRRLSLENGGNKVTELNKNLNERRLTVRECARIQTFPDNYNFVIGSDSNLSKFSISPSHAYKLVGNAVPPLMAYHLAKRLALNWERYFGSF